MVQSLCKEDHLKKEYLKAQEAEEKQTLDQTMNSDKEGSSAGKASKGALTSRRSS